MALHLRPWDVLGRRGWRTGAAGVRGRAARDAVESLLERMDPHPGPSRRSSWTFRTLSDPDDGPRVLAAERRDRDGDRPGAGCWVVKVSGDLRGADRLRHEMTALDAIHACEELRDWRRFVPRTVAFQQDGETGILITTVLPGRSPSPRAGVAYQPAALMAALEAIRPLHAATQVRSPVEADLRDDWVRRPISRLELAMERSSLIELGERPLRMLEHELLTALARRPIVASMAHGDFWPANLLVDEAGRILGIVDWEGALQPGSPAHDALGLMLAARRIRARGSTGEATAAWLGAESHGSPLAADDAERAAFAVAEAAGLEPRAAILLAWLAMVDGSLRRRPSVADRPGWLRRNVSPVVAA